MVESAGQRRQTLSSRMRRVLSELRRVRRSVDVDGVHDLRVAIRRCRTVGAIMEEVDAHPSWREMRRRPRALFRTLGALRDLQVLEHWVGRLAVPDDPVRPRLLKVLEERQALPREAVLRAARAFDDQAWRRLARTLERRARLVSPDSLAARCLGLERYRELVRLHDRAARTEAPKPWHALRIGLKRFRYTVENLLPGLSAGWDEGLGRMQNLLGSIHDLDVLAGWIDRHPDDPDAAAAPALRQAIEAERRSCVEQYQSHTSGPDGLLQVWKAGLTEHTTIAEATAARLRTTARAMDPNPRRTAAIARLARQIFDALGASGAEPRFRDPRLRTVLAAAAQLHAIRAGGGRRSRKAARDFLLGVPVPLGWKARDWEVLADVVRYQRGAEPSPRHRRFGRLPGGQQDRIRGLAGVLRVARGLHRSGATPSRRVRAQATPAGVRLRVAHLIVTRKSAARLASAKFLLDTYLGRPLLIEAAPDVRRGTTRRRRNPETSENSRTA